MFLGLFLSGYCSEVTRIVLLGEATAMRDCYYHEGGFLICNNF